MNLIYPINIEDIYYNDKKYFYQSNKTFSGFYCSTKII